MATTVIVIDWRARFGGVASAAPSLLDLPLGAETLAGALRRELAAANVDSWVVALNESADADDRRAVEASVAKASILEPAGFGRFLDTYEPADWLLFVDARRLPRGDLGRLLPRNGEPARPEALHLVHRQRNADGTRERVVCDAEDHVRVIQRLYEGRTHLNTAAVSCTLISVAMARHLQRGDLFSPERMRTRLAASGVPGRDVTAVGPALDLLQPQDLLALSESVTFAALRGPAPSGFSEYAPGVLVGARCRIHPGSRMYGPVIVHDDVVIDVDAVVIGPAVLGTGVRVGRQALVSQSLIAAEVRIRAGASVVNRVLVDGMDSASVAEPPAPSARAHELFAPEAGSSARAVPLHRAASRHPAALAKRVFDAVLALAGLLLLSPLLVVVAALIKLTSRGPVLFSHEREGRGGRVFRCWKFRTMVHGAHALQRALYRENLVDGPQFKLPRDPRVTRLGHWLRLTNIDELPQLYNVLRGEMSLIGPRPSPFRENQICVPWREARLAVRPGITGLWQVCRADRSAGDFHQWIHMDLLYVRHWSLSLDFRIFLATLLTLGGRWSVPLRWMIPGGDRREALLPPTGAAQAPPAVRFEHPGGHVVPALPVVAASDRGEPDRRVVVRR